MANANSKLEWMKFDIDTLPEELVSLLDTYRDLESQASAAKKAFTDAFTEAAEEAGLGAPKGHDMVISLRFNDISLAYAPQREKKAAQNRVGFNTTTVKPTATRGKKRVLTPSK